MSEFEIRQRKTMGVLVILLPIITILFGLIGKEVNPAGWFNSISDTYYSNSNAIMVGIIAISSFFFCTYKGYDWRDRVVNLMSGIGLAGLLIFPCLNEGYANYKVGVFLFPSEFSNLIHTIFAITAFIGFFLNIEFLFTLSSGEKTEKKKIRNIIYRICGFSICPIAFFLLLFTFLGKLPPYFVWIAEAISLIPCGFAWLVKGEAFKVFNDD